MAEGDAKKGKQSKVHPEHVWIWDSDSPTTVVSESVTHIFARTMTIDKDTGRTYVRFKTMGKKKKEVAETEIEQPQLPSSFFLDLLLPADKKDDFLANMEEIYLTRWLPRHGKAKADWIWRYQTAMLIFNRALGYVLSLWDKIKAIKIN